MKLAKTLIELGANPKARYLNGHNIVDRMMEATTGSIYGDKATYHHAIVEFMITNMGGPTALNYVPVQHCSLLEYALILKHKVAIKHFLSLGANLSTRAVSFNFTTMMFKQQEGITCLDICLDYFISDADFRESIFEILSEHIDVMNPKLWENVSLQEAVCHKNLPLLSLLLKLKRDPNDVDDQGYIALDYVNLMLQSYKSKHACHAEKNSGLIPSLNKTCAHCNTATTFQKMQDLLLGVTPVTIIPGVNALKILSFDIFEDFSQEQMFRERYLQEMSKTLRFSSILSTLKVTPFQKLTDGYESDDDLNHSILFSHPSKNDVFEDDIGTSLIFSHKVTQQKVNPNVNKNGKNTLDVLQHEEPPMILQEPCKELLQETSIPVSSRAMNITKKSLFSSDKKLAVEDLETFRVGSPMSPVCPMVSPCDKTKESAHSIYSQHKKLMWALFHRNQKQYLNQKLKDVSTPRFSVPVLNSNCLNFLDFTNDSNYNFLVHTTSGEPKILAETLKTGAQFIRETQFFSASLIDKDIPPAEMSHHGKILFPLSLVIDVAEGSVLKAFPLDAWSPQLSQILPENRDLIAKNYIKEIESQNRYFNDREEMIRGFTATDSLDSRSDDSTKDFVRDESVGEVLGERDIKNHNEKSQTQRMDLETILSILKRDSQFEEPSYGSPGKIPELTPLQTLKQTRSHYNEVIVAGHPKNRVVGIVVEKKALFEFIKSLDDKNIDTEDQKTVSEALESLRILAETKFPLILIDTQSNGYANKTSPRDRIPQLQKCYNDCVHATQQLMLRQYRLHGSKKTANQLMTLERITQELKSNMEKIKNCRAEVFNLKKLMHKARSKSV